MLDKLIYSTSLQKVLYFLLSHPDEKYYDREISRLSKVSKASTNFALRDLVKTNLISREKKGRMCFYYADLSSNLIQQLKIAQNMIKISSLINKLEDCCIKMILFGSSAKGKNHKESDLDLFILTSESDKVKKVIFKSPLKEKIQYHINTPQDVAKLKRDKSVFYKEIASGITVYEKK
ncbi:nucleotidyltransferase domain-containing protein [Candidatus Omnitrophota bacterium]